MKVFAAVVIITAILIGGFLVFNKSKDTSVPLQTTPIPSPTPDSKPLVEVIAKNLEVPWALAFLPNGDILVTERIGRVRLIKNSRLEEKSVAIINVKQTGESGLHGIAIHPNYPEKPYIYLYLTYLTGGEIALNRVSRFTFDEQSLKDEQIIVDKIPGAISHDGGRIKFGPDGYLYITTGDAQNPSLSQDKNSLAGKILRVTDEGKPVPGNPFGTLVYSYGHRNPQGIAWDSKGNLWETEHGQTATDELNLIEPGKNYGWPVTYGDQTQEGMIKPILQSGDNTWAPAGVAFFNESIFFAGLRGQALFEVKTDNPATLKEHFKGQFGRIRDVVLGPDNLLYITISNRDGRGNPTEEDDKILRINPGLL